MSEPFDAQQGLIILPVEITGPAGTAVVQMALDTGSMGTLIESGLLIPLGYDPANAPQRAQITTGSGTALAPRLTVERIKALGKEQIDFSVVCHTFPPSAGIDGVLGLDFLRGHVLTVDFTTGQVNLS